MMETTSNQLYEDNTGANKINTQLSPQEEALQSLCKQILKSKLFRGFYIERRFVQSLNNYRDVISLHRSEKELEKIILDIGRRLYKFYTYSETPNVWIGITNGPLVGTNLPVGALETHIWVEIGELAFGQYWFSIKSIRFRGNEILLKLKVVREVVDDEISISTPLKQRKRLSANESTLKSSVIPNNTIGNQFVLNKNVNQTRSSNEAETPNQQQQTIDIQDFIEIFYQWAHSIKHTVYEFMSQDINKENIKAVIRFIGLLLFSIITATLAAIKFIGVFTLRFMFEFSRFMHVMTPIVLKVIEVCNKIIGGFYILIAMIWRDVMGKKNNEPTQKNSKFQEIEYNRPLYRAIKYDTQK